MSDLAEPELDDVEVTGPPLGSGAFSTVWPARQVTLDRAVALKVLRPSSVDPDALERLFERESLSLGRVSGHPNIVTVYEVGRLQHPTLGRAPYLLLELCVAMPRPPRALYAAMHDAIVVGEALDFAHGLGILHGDVKPNNVLQRDGQPRLSDFGISLVLDLTRLRHVEGWSVGWAAPEVVERGHSKASDVFSLATVLVYWLTGERVATNEHIDAVGPAAAGLPPGLRDLLGSARSTDVAARPSMPEFVAELRKHRASSATGPNGSSRDTRPAFSPLPDPPTSSGDRASAAASRPVVQAGAGSDTSSVANNEGSVGTATVIGLVAAVLSLLAAVIGLAAAGRVPIVSGGGASDGPGEVTSAPDQVANDDVERLPVEAGANDRVGPARGAVVFGRDPGDGPLAFMLDITTGEETLLTRNAAAPSIAADGTLAYTCEDAICVRAPDGASLVRFRSFTGGRVSEPAISPDARRVVWVEGQPGDRDLVLRSVDGLTDAELVAASTSDDASPSFAEDGRVIVFDSTRSGNGDIYLYDVETRGTTRLTDGEATDEDPALSPDGRTLALVRQFDGQRDVVIVEALSSVDLRERRGSIRRLTTTTTAERSPTFLPDGEHLVLSEQLAGGGFRLALLDLTGVSTPLTGGGDLDLDPSARPRAEGAG